MSIEYPVSNDGADASEHQFWQEDITNNDPQKVGHSFWMAILSIPLPAAGVIDNCLICASHQAIVPAHSAVLRQEYMYTICPSWITYSQSHGDKSQCILGYSKTLLFSRKLHLRVPQNAQSQLVTHRSRLRNEGMFWSGLCQGPGDQHPFATNRRPHQHACIAVSMRQ